MSEPSPRLLDRYESDAAAARYERLHRGRRRHKRESECLRSALQELQAGAHVLDLPCGTGRMFPTLASLGLRITGADAADAMVRRALSAAAEFPSVCEIRVEDAFHTSFDDASFDAAVCNRLLHHFEDAEDRRAVLRELHRVSKGLVVASFFCSHSWDALRTRIKRSVRSIASDRRAISLRAFRADVEAAGLRCERVIPALAGISQQWYVVARGQG